MDIITAPRPLLLAAVDDDAEPVGALLWQAAGADAAFVAVGVVIGVLIGRWLK
jgi:hypothetical protein